MRIWNLSRLLQQLELVLYVCIHKFVFIYRITSRVDNLQTEIFINKLYTLDLHLLSFFSLFLSLVCVFTSKEMASPVVINATTRHTASLIFLHGLGDSGHGWSAGFEQIREPHIKYICPNAPVMPVSLNGGLMMPSWFDLYSLDPSGSEDEKGIKKAAENLRALIAEEEKHVPSNRIVIGGFSQGGSLSLYTALTMSKPMAGVLALSTWLPLHKSFPAVLKWNSSTPVLQCHGEADPMVSIAFGKITSQVIKSFPTPNHEFKTYPGLSHSSSQEEMLDVKRWLMKVLPPKD